MIAVDAGGAVIMLDDPKAFSARDRRNGRLGLDKYARSCRLVKPSVMPPTPTSPSRGLASSAFTLVKQLVLSVS